MEVTAGSKDSPLKEVVTIPNLVTAARLALVFPLGMFLWERSDTAAFITACIMAAGDVLDGWIARKFSMQSKVGAFLDPAADKLTALVAFYILAIRGDLPTWLFATALARDAALVGGFTILFVKGLQEKPQPTLSGKLATLSQFLVIFAVIFPRSLWKGFEPLILPLCAACAICLIISFIDYGKRAISAAS